jgi:hypothetical protein
MVIIIIVFPFILSKITKIYKQKNKKREQQICNKKKTDPKNIKKKRDLIFSFLSSEIQQDQK